MFVIVGMSTEEHFLRSQVHGYRVRIKLFVGTVEQDFQSQRHMTASINVVVNRLFNNTSTECSGMTFLNPN